MVRLVIYGAGGFGHEVITAARYRSAVLADDKHGRGIIDPAEITAKDEVVIAIADGAIRRHIALAPRRYGKVIAPTAVIGADVTIGEGAIFCDHTMVTARAVIGRHFHCNIYSFVPHDCVIGDFVTFSPGVRCGGNVHIENDVFIGSGAIIKNGFPDRPLRIGAGAIVGCGAVVTKDVAPGTTVVGNPARIMLPKLRAA